MHLLVMLWSRLGRTGLCRRWGSTFRDVDSLPVNEALKASLRAMGAVRLTRVQSEVFAPISAGQSCLAIAKTGEGKTLAYLTPLIARLANERLLSSNTTSCIIAVPTRELCQQVAGVLVALNTNINVLLAYGKPDNAFNVLLRQNPHVIVGTGGRLASLAGKGELDLGRIKIAVFDEIDSMLSHDYRKEVTPLMQALPADTQVVAVGATMSADLREVLSEFPWHTAATQIDTVTSRDKTPGKIRHFAVKVSDSVPVRIGVVGALLASRRFEKAIVFAPTSADATAIARHPALVSKARVLHGDLPQTERERILNSFRGGSFPILVSTDVASRGVDVPGVDVVISFNVPTDSVAYIHRAGRTGRAGSRGESIVMYTGRERADVERLFTTAGSAFENMPCPSKEEQNKLVIASIIEEAVQLGSSKVGSKLDVFLSQLTETDRIALAGACLRVLAGSAHEPRSPKKSILSGEPGFSPVLFVDPGCVVIQSRGDLVSALERAQVPMGLVALSESGFVADIKTADAISLCSERVEEIQSLLGVEVVLVDKLPKLVEDQITRGRKRSTVLPWRRKP